MPHNVWALVERLTALKGSKPLTLSAEGGGIPERLQVMNAAAYVINYALLEEIIVALAPSPKDSPAPEAAG